MSLPWTKRAAFEQTRKSLAYRFAYVRPLIWLHARLFVGCRRPIAFLQPLEHAIARFLARALTPLSPVLHKDLELVAELGTDFAIEFLRVRVRSSMTMCFLLFSTIARPIRRISTLS